jgi:hypothetical protein
MPRPTPAQSRNNAVSDFHDIAVAEKMYELQDALLESGYRGHQLEVLLARLVYCLFADATGIFPQDHFRRFLEQKTDENGANAGAMLSVLFQLLDTPTAARHSDHGEDLPQFPHVSGALFRHRIDPPCFNRKMRRLLLEACALDWSEVSPSIFGSLSQSAMDRNQRRHLGAHYTDEQNILKVVRGLCLKEFYAEFASLKHDAARLRQFHERLARLRFFDPACGSGNFLVVAYREVRRLETEVLKQLRELSGRSQPVPDVAQLSRIDVGSFYGIESEDFSAQIATVALWLTDHQANLRLSAEFGLRHARLPLRKTPNIVQANALRLDWNDIISRAGNETETTLYILGNPPFVGKKVRNDSQNKDMELVFGGLRDQGILDYACAWYAKAADFIQHTQIKVAFVSTNSITQGEQVGVLWNYLRERQIKIHFAHRTFKWTNEARGQAAVHCVIVGFAAFDLTRKHLYDYQTPTSRPHDIECQNINPYLVDQPDVVITNRKTPLSDVPPLVFGNMPNDGGQLLFSDEERADFLAREPLAEKFILPLISAHEFINGENRWCLWLEGAQRDEWRKLPEVWKRVQAVRAYRLRSKRPATLKLAETPYLFGEIRQPASAYVLIPLHSSENRKYVPMAFFPPRHIVSNSCSALANATLYHFAVLTSNMHMGWLRQLCGRIKSDYRYSNNLVYNNFPFPLEPNAKQKARAEEAAQTILEVRAKYPASTLADLYDPNSMPQDLLEAHRTVDSAVDACYGSRRFKTDLERLECLFDLYRQYTAPLTQQSRARFRAGDTRSAASKIV